MKRILVVEDQRIHREYMENIINYSGKYELVTSVTAADLAFTICKEKPVDLILMDIAVNGSMDGIEAAGEIKKHFSEIKIVIVTSMLDELCLIRAKEAGADSLWYKDASKEDLINVIDETMKGEHIFPDAAPQVSIGYGNNKEFTKTENIILREIVNGLSNKQIAAKLSIGTSTVEWHVGNLLSKTGLPNRTMLAIKAARGNLFVLSDTED